MKTKKQLEEENRNLKAKLSRGRSFEEDLILAREAGKQRHSIGLGTFVLAKIFGFDKLGGTK